MPKTHLTVVVPTYNEAIGIASFFHTLTESLFGIDYEIIFVDDSSDQTPQTITALAEGYSNVRLIHREASERTGLATAFMTGWESARGEYVCCIDADLQHPPHIIQELLKNIVSNQADMAVASRYTAGGSAIGLGSTYRRLVSRAASRFSQIFLPGARTTTDPMSGFFLFRRELLSGVELAPRGFKILLEILVRTNTKKVIDVPYVFGNRHQGESKATLAQGQRFLEHVANLTAVYPIYRRLSRFLLIGLSGALINLGTLWFLTTWFTTPVKIAWLGGVLISILHNFILHNRFTFTERQARSWPEYFSVYISYTLLSLATIGVNYFFFTKAMALGIHYLPAAAGGIIAATALNFLGSNVMVWTTNNRPAFTLSSLIKIGIAAFCFYLLGGFLADLPIAARIIAFFSLLLTVQGLVAIFLMLYAWEDPDRAESYRSPQTWAPPTYSFTALLPARHEENVIAQTIRAISRLNYPEHLKETIVICRNDDIGTITAARRAISEIGTGNIRVITFDGYPINKPHGLNIGLAEAQGNVVAVFDAEDEPHTDIYQIANTVMLRNNSDVLQSGVQLMNHDSTWFSLFNVLEYFFWFKSTLHFFARRGFTPLGGNTVFFKREWLEHINGWDEGCLTEDADIGIRLAVAGAKTSIVYDERHVTQEETPSTVWGFIKQRTRWNQGFIQIFAKGDWLKLPGEKRRWAILLSIYLFTWPIVQGLLFLYVPFAIWIALTVKLPLLVALISNLPLIVLLFFLVVYNVGIYEFTHVYKRHYSLWTPLQSVLFFIPFQLLLGFAAFRAVARNLQNNFGWEKTAHSNAHRLEKPGQIPQTTRTKEQAPALQPVRQM
jgi:cellulose synthase/poly-beta-1,6-N-acetylglucosamine synthase-like glycosyltransferase/putative flippase GtrA